MKVIKRDDSSQEFCLDKIIQAVNKANKSVDESLQMDEKTIQKVIVTVQKNLEGFSSIKVEDIQDMVENALMKNKQYQIAHNYIVYRNEHKKKSLFTDNEQKIFSLINGTSDLRGDNANKRIDDNGAISDYIAGIVTKSINDKLLPKDVVKAHKDGRIHWHDSDYSPLRPMHNCFLGSQQFLTDNGICRFDEFNDGDKVVVYDMNLIKRDATVHFFGNQPVNKVIITTNDKKYKQHTSVVYVTENHTWILSDGSRTTELKVGDKLFSYKPNYNDISDYALKFQPLDEKFGLGITHQVHDIDVIVDSIEPYKNGEAFPVYCVTEPVTHSFMLGDGIITGNCDVLNVEDMLEQGFQMNSTKIEPNSETPFRTICNLMSQISLLVSGRQYGGQTFSWAHTLPYIDSSRQMIRRNLMADIEKMAKLPKWDGWYAKIFNKLPKFLQFTKGVTVSEEYINDTVEKKLREEIHEGVKTYQYQILCHSSSNGQTPFVSNNLCLREATTQRELDDFAILIEEIFKRRIKGIKDHSGHYISPLFPKLLYWTCDGLNVKENDPYFYLTELAAECEIKRMQPDIVSEKETRRVKEGQIIPSMGCRSLLGPIWEDVKYPLNKEFYYTEITEKTSNDKFELLGRKDQRPDSCSSDWTIISKGEKHQYPYGKFVNKQSFNGLDNGIYKTGYEEGEFAINFRGNTGWLKEKTDEYVIVSQPIVYGRFNMGVISLNIPFVALEAKEESEKEGTDILKVFYRILEERLELIHKGLKVRNDFVRKIKGKNSEILWMHGALCRIGSEETVGEYMDQHPTRASISVGYAGLYETCRALIGESNTTEKGQKLSEEILQFMNNKCTEWKMVGDLINDKASTVLNDNEDFEID